MKEAQGRTVLVNKVRHKIANLSKMSGAVEKRAEEEHSVVSKSEGWWGEWCSA